MTAVPAMRAPPLAAPQSAHTPIPPPPRLAVALAIAAVLLQLTVSANLLTMLGIAYSTEGGNLLVKFHPATYLAFLALAARLFASDRPLRTLDQLLRQFPRVTLFLGMIAICIVWVVVNIGVGGVAVYVENYVSAGVLFLAMADMGMGQRRMLGRLMLLAFAANALLSIGETVVRRHLMPLYLAHGLIFNDTDLEFRGLALYDHALTGAMMTQMALLLLVGMNLRPRTALMIGVPLLVGLISFGGRTALLVCLVTLLGIGGTFLIRGLLARTLRPAVIAMAVACVAAGAALLVFLISETAIGVRLAGKLSFHDESSLSRTVQWLMPGQLSATELLFGISTTRQVEYIYQLGLTYRFLIVENFWLVAFLNLGAIGFLFYLTGFLSFLVDLWRFAPLFGRAILVTTIVVASTSSSLSHKINTLFVMTAAVVATTGFARDQEGRSHAARRVGAGPRLSREAVRPLPGGAGALSLLAGTGEGVAEVATDAEPGVRRRALRPLRLTMGS